MSMLAERKRKTKWVINPTKKPIWTTESNGIKFGKELMEKMGWSAGKGLGAKEQGIQEPLKVSYKNDTKGMGFKGNDDDWIEQQDEFNVLLNQLRSSDDSSVVKLTDEEKNHVKSLEEKSKLSRARVHYQKFTRGKDLSKYSENDLACILGTNKTKKEKPKTEEVVQSEVKGDDHLETSFGVTTINSGSIQDYFKKKWTADRFQQNNVPKADEEKGEHFNDDEKPCFSAESEKILKSESKEKSKKKKPKSEDESLCVDETEMCDFDEKCRKRKKSKREDKEDDVHRSLEDEPEVKKRKKHSNDDNPVNEVLQGVGGEEVKNCESLSLENENDCDLLRKRKKNKKQLKSDEKCLEEKQEKKADFAVQEVDSLENCSDAKVESEEVKKKKKKKEKKEKLIKSECCDAEDTPVDLVSAALDVQGTEKEEEPDRKKKKKEKKHEVADNCNKENIADHSSEVDMGKTNGIAEEENVLSDKQKKKKKKKHKNHSGSAEDEKNLGDDNLGKENDIHDSDALEMVSKKKKKKKEKHKENNEAECHENQNGIPNNIPTEKSLAESNCINELEQHKEKKKKKDKHRTKEKEDCGSANNQESCMEETCKEDLQDSCVVTESVKKKKKKDKKKETKECSEGDFDTAEVESVKKKKKKLSESEQNENDGKEKIETKRDENSSLNKSKTSNGVGNSGIGAQGIDKVEMITQRAAYEHVPGQHTYERVKSMIQWVNLQQFRGSNLESLDGYGHRPLRKCEKNAR